MDKARIGNTVIRLLLVNAIISVPLATRIIATPQDLVFDMLMMVVFLG